MEKRLRSFYSKLRHHRDIIGIVFCFFFATSTFFFRDLNLVLIFNILAWACIALLIVRQRKIRNSIRKAIEVLGLETTKDSLIDIIKEFTKETARFHRASFAFKSDTKSQKLVENLSKVTELAYRELPAQAVEMKLFEQQSGLGSNSLVLGFPSSQFANYSESNNDSQVIEVKGIKIITEPISFAGKKFGNLKLEIKKNTNLTKADLQVLRLLAAQAGISLVNARFTEELLRLKKLSDETSQAKTGFLANLSHELRGPLGIILNAVELTSDGLCGEVSPQMAEMLRMIGDSGNHLLDLVNDVLDYAKVEAGKVKAVPVVLSLKDLLEDLCSVVRTQAHAKQHQLILNEINPSWALTVDKRHVRQMLINLLTNAIKYTQNGGKIIVRAEKKENSVSIYVEDNGVGIAEQEQSKVFKAFERVDNQYSLNQVGTGLGMPLTKKLAEVNGGTVDFKSELNLGSTFWLTLPSVEIAQAVSSVSNKTVNYDLNGRGETVVLVDNNNGNREMLKLYLVKQGFKVLDVESGVALISLVKTTQIDLVVIESDLPDLSGEDLIIAIRSIPQIASMPTILLSARAFVFDIERCLKIGVDLCLSKPVSLNELATSIRRLIDASSKLEEKTFH